MLFRDPDWRGLNSILRKDSRSRRWFVGNNQTQIFLVHRANARIGGCIAIAQRQSQFFISPNMSDSLRR